MTAVTLWLLIAIQAGGGNIYRPTGVVTIVDRFATAADCGAVITELKSQGGPAANDVQWRCVPAKVARP